MVNFGIKIDAALKEDQEINSGGGLCQTLESDVLTFKAESNFLAI